MNQKIHDFNSHLTTKSNEMAFWFVPVLRPNPNILPNKDAQDHYSSSNIPPLKIPRRAFFRPTFKQSSASHLSMVWPYHEVQQPRQAKPKFMKHKSWTLSNREPKKDSSYLCSSSLHHHFFFLLHKSEGKKKVLFHLCNRTNYLQAKGMLSGASLCDWQALPTGMNKSGDKGRVVEEAVAGGLQETWEPWRVQVSTPHPSSLNALL